MKTDGALLCRIFSNLRPMHRRYYASGRFLLLVMPSGAGRFGPYFSSFDFDSDVVGVAQTGPFEFSTMVLRVGSVIWAALITLITLWTAVPIALLALKAVTF